jgi:hypothetical protein
MESKTEIVWSAPWVQWLLPSTIFTRGATPRRLSTCGSVLTIDNDSRINPRASFERVLAVERDVVSDIQAFGYIDDDTKRTTSDANLPALWYLVRQDLYLNDQATAFLVVHWKHTLDLISLLDVIPGDGTQLVHA